MKRDLFKDGFTAEDFNENTYLDMQDLEDVAEKANAILRKALEQAQTVNVDLSAYSGPSVGFKKQDTDTHEAKLVAIKETEEK